MAKLKHHLIHSKRRGAKIIYTNGSRFHAERVTKARGLDGIFDAMYGIEHSDYHPKPTPKAFEAIFKLDDITPDVSAMFEDDVRNLRVPFYRGMKTVLVGPAQQEPFVEYATQDLADFLSRLMA